jgi:glucan biosynthesis protein C
MQHGRRTDVEWLRVIAMATVFVVHVAHVFSPWQYWHIQDADRPVWAGQLSLFAWPWVMPLFMALAGAGAFFSLGKRSDRTFLRERTLRLVLPFVLGTLILIPPQIYVERLAQGRFEGGYLAFLPTFFECCYPENNLAAGHLWFIAYLYAYSVAALPLLRRLSGPGGRPALDAAATMCAAPGGILWLAVPVIATQIALRGFFPQTHAFYNDWANHAILFLGFLYGFLLAADARILDALDRQWRRAAVPAAALSLALAWYAIADEPPGTLPAAWTGSYFAFWTAFGAAGWFWIVALVGFTRRHLDRTHGVLRYASRRVYPIYLVHQTAIVVVAYFVVQWPLEPVVKFAVLTALALAVTLLVAEPMRLLVPANRVPPGVSAAR